MVGLKLKTSFGLWSALEIPAIEQGVATPWVGLKERIFWYGYQSWFAVLAITLLRRLSREEHWRISPRSIEEHAA